MPLLLRSSLLSCACLLGLACGGERPARPLIGEPAREADELSSLRRFAMDRVLDYRVWSGARAGFVALAAHDGRLVYTRTTGLADVGAGVPMSLDTRFQLASMTKPITAVAAMILVEEGRLSLDDPVSRFVPFFADMRVVVDRAAAGELETRPLSEPIRVRHLLTFTSGIGGYDESDARLDQLWRASDIEAEGLGSLGERIERIRGLPLYEQPGERWRYGWSLDVLARVVEVAADEPYDAFLQRSIFDPLGMSATSFPSGVRQEAPLAKLYTHDEDGTLVRDMQFDGWYGYGWTPGGGGLVSTASDYMRFALMLSNGGSAGNVRILSRESVAEMARLHVPSGVLADMEIEGLGFGLGVCVVADADEVPMPRASNGDYWWSGRFGTHFWISPASDTVVVVMQQTERSATSGLPITPLIVQALAVP